MTTTNDPNAIKKTKIRRNSYPQSNKEILEKNTQEAIKSVNGVIENINKALNTGITNSKTAWNKYRKEYGDYTTISGKKIDQTVYAECSDQFKKLLYLIYALNLINENEKKLSMLRKSYQHLPTVLQQIGFAQTSLRQKASVLQSQIAVINSAAIQLQEYLYGDLQEEDVTLNSQEYVILNSNKKSSTKNIHKNNLETRLLKILDEYAAKQNQNKTTTPPFLASPQDPVCETILKSLVTNVRDIHNKSSNFSVLETADMCAYPHLNKNLLLRKRQWLTQRIDAQTSLNNKLNELVSASKKIQITPRISYVFFLPLIFDAFKALKKNKIEREMSSIRENIEQLKTEGSELEIKLQQVNKEIENTGKIAPQQQPKYKSSSKFKHQSLTGDMLGNAHTISGINTENMTTIPDDAPYSSGSITVKSTYSGTPYVVKNAELPKAESEIIAADFVSALTNNSTKYRLVLDDEQNTKTQVANVASKLILGFRPISSLEAEEKKLTQNLSYEFGAACAINFWLLDNTDLNNANYGIRYGKNNEKHVSFLDFGGVFNTKIKTSEGDNLPTNNKPNIIDSFDIDKLNFGQPTFDYAVPDDDASVRKEGFQNVSEKDFRNGAYYTLTKTLVTFSKEHIKEIAQQHVDPNSERCGEIVKYMSDKVALLKQAATQSSKYRTYFLENFPNIMAQLLQDTEQFNTPLLKKKEIHPEQWGGIDPKSIKDLLGKVLYDVLWNKIVNKVGKKIDIAFLSQAIKQTQQIASNCIKNPSNVNKYLGGIEEIANKLKKDNTTSSVQSNPSINEKTTEKSAIFYPRRYVTNDDIASALNKEIKKDAIMKVLGAMLINSLFTPENENNEKANAPEKNKEENIPQNTTNFYNDVTIFDPQTSLIKKDKVFLKWLADNANNVNPPKIDQNSIVIIAPNKQFSAIENKLKEFFGNSDVPNEKYTASKETVVVINDLSPQQINAFKEHLRKNQETYKKNGTLKIRPDSKTSTNALLTNNPESQNQSNNQINPI